MVPPSVAAALRDKFHPLRTRSNAPIAAGPAHPAVDHLRGRSAARELRDKGRDIITFGVGEQIYTPGAYPRRASAGDAGRVALHRHRRLSEPRRGGGGGLAEVHDRPPKAEKHPWSRPAPSTASTTRQAAPLDDGDEVIVPDAVRWPSHVELWCASPAGSRCSLEQRSEDGFQPRSEPARPAHHRARGRFCQQPEQPHRRGLRRQNPRRTRRGGPYPR